jgi:hypothetical protein
MKHAVGQKSTAKRIKTCRIGGFIKEVVIQGELSDIFQSSLSVPATHYCLYDI